MPSHEALQAFSQAASLGSFSAAARMLGKSQSSISASIAQLEIDLGLTLFDRSTRKPTLTEAGQHLLRHAEAVLAAGDQLAVAAAELLGGQEARLSVALSDTYHSARFERCLADFAERFPRLRLECLVAEDADLVTLVQQGRVQLAFAEQQPHYPTDLSHARVSESTDFCIFVAREHPLAQRSWVSRDELDQHRALHLSTVLSPYQSAVKGQAWSASSYLILMEMAQRGFGWAALPQWLVQRFALDTLVQIPVHGWPRSVYVDALWSRLKPLGPAARWLRARMLDSP